MSVIHWTVDYRGIPRRWCVLSEIHEHLPHFWYDQERLRWYFCRGKL